MRIRESLKKYRKKQTGICYEQIPAKLQASVSLLGVFA